jgi:hypothetical protein
VDEAHGGDFRHALRIGQEGGETSFTCHGGKVIDCESPIWGRHPANSGWAVYSCWEMNYGVAKGLKSGVSENRTGKWNMSQRVINVQDIAHLLAPGRECFVTLPGLR